MTITRYESKKPAYQTSLYHGQPPKDSTAIFAWETFTSLANYSDQSLVSVFMRISRDIIERPYHYDEHWVFNAKGEKISYSFTRANNTNPPEKIDGIAVYKQNHGTGHAIRQMIYTKVLIEKIVLEGNDKGKKIAQVINDNSEIKSILKLAAYCKRIGRTFDHEHDNHPQTPTIYSVRSAEMFEMIATELGYNKDLITVITDSMFEDNPRTSHVLKGQNILGIDYIDLRDFSKSVLMAAHMADLARLFTVRIDFIIGSLNAYFEPKKVAPISIKLIEMACEANIFTGNPVVRQAQEVTHTLSRINGKKLVAVVSDIEGTIKTLNTFAIGELVTAGAKPKALKAETSEPTRPTTPEVKLTEPDPIVHSTELLACKKELEIFLKKLDEKKRKLAKKATHNPQEYREIAEEINTLYLTLTDEKLKLFQQPITSERLTQFSLACIKAINSIKQAKEHRGWHKIHPILRGIVGVLAVFAAFIIEKTSNHGYINTFFAKPQTDTAQKIEQLKNSFEGEIIKMNQGLQ